MDCEVGNVDRLRTRVLTSWFGLSSRGKESGREGEGKEGNCHDRFGGRYCVCDTEVSL